MSIKSETLTPTRKDKRSITIKKNKAETKRKKFEIINDSNNNKKIVSENIRKNLINREEDSEEESELDSFEEENNENINNLKRGYLHNRNLTKNKKGKRYGGKGKFLKGINNDYSFVPAEGNDDDLAKNINEERKKNKNYDKSEELEILKEVEEMDEALTLDEKKYILSEMNELRNLIANQNNNDEETRDKIDSKRMSIYKIVNRFFINWIAKDIELKVVDPEKYKNKLAKLVKIQNYRIYSERNLRILENKYIIPYIEKEKKKKQEEEKKKKKLLRKIMDLQEFERYKKLIEDKKRTGLVYDNSYLFKKSKKKFFKLRKEVEEILNTDYGMYLQKKKKKLPEKKKKKIKKKTAKKLILPRRSILEKRELTKEEKDEEEERIRLFREMEEKQRLEEILDKKLQNFFERIQRLKEGKFTNFEEELNFLIEEQMNQAERAKKRKEMRMNSFMKELQFNRVKAKYTMDFKNKQISFISPIVFTSDK